MLLGPWLLGVREALDCSDLGSWLGVSCEPMYHQGWGPCRQDHTCWSPYPSRHVGDPGDIQGMDAEAWGT